MADTSTDFNGLPAAGTLESTDVVPIQRGTGASSTKKTTVADMPISTAQQSALNAKADDADVVHKAGSETIAGAKTFTDAVQVQRPSNFWSSGSAFFIGGLGWIGSNGNNNTSVMSNSYRTTETKLAPLGAGGNNTSASSIDLNPSGEIQFRGGAIPATGVNLPLTASIDASGNMTVVGNITAANLTGAQTGDMLLTARAPGAGWLKQGTVYLQSSYPALYALVGLIPDAPPGRLWASGTSPGSLNDLCVTDEGTLIAVGNNAVWRSTNKGSSWSTVTVSGNLLNVTHSNGVLLACGGSGVLLRSVDDGLNWSTITTSVSDTLRNVSFLSQNVAVLFRASGSASYIWRSADAGVTWSAATTSLSSTALNVLAAFTPLIASAFSANKHYRTIDGGLNWSAMDNLPVSVGSNTSPATFSASVGILPTGTASTYLRSVDQGETWTSQTLTGGVQNTDLIRIDETRAVWPGGVTGAVSFITNDAGVTWKPITAVAASRGRFVDETLAVAWHSSNFFKSSAEYAYDTATMFKTPTASDVRGYIKP